MEIKNHNTAGCFLTKNEVSEILLIYKRWSDDNQGWTLPKGHQEAGETLEETAVRETKEETGYQDFNIVKPLQVLNINYDWSDGYRHHKAIHYFLAELISDEHSKPNLEESEIKTQVKIQWFTLEQAKEVLLFDDEREILTKLIK